MAINSTPKNIYVISATTTDVAATPVSGKFSAITCSVAGTVKVTGGGIFQYVDVSDSPDPHANFIDADTGLVYATDDAMDTDGDGFFETVSTVEVDLVMIAGQTIYGKFDSVKSDGTFTGFAYTS